MILHGKRLSSFDEYKQHLWGIPRDLKRISVSRQWFYGCLRFIKKRRKQCCVYTSVSMLFLGSIVYDGAMAEMEAQNPLLAQIL